MFYFTCNESRIYESFTFWNVTIKKTFSWYNFFSNKQQSFPCSSDNSYSISPPSLLLEFLFFSPYCTIIGGSYYEPIKGYYYYELELSLRFEPPSQTVSQVPLSLSGRADWADKLVKYLNLRVGTKVHPSSPMSTLLKIYGLATGVNYWNHF